MDRCRPAQFVDRAADDSAIDLHHVNEQTHRDGCCLPAARGESAEEIVGGARVGVEGLRVVAARELDDLVFGNFLSLAEI